MTRPLKAGNRTATVFIDGEAGTTGLQIAERLAGLHGVRVLSIATDKRKDDAARRDMMRQADVIILCLPDDAAREAVVLADSLGDEAPAIIDASTAHRVAPGWVYGFPELLPGGEQANAVRSATRVANPGCYATGAIALLRPLIESGFFPADHPFTINAVSGYTGGGKSMIATYDSGKGPAFELYALGLAHKHIPEIVAHSGLARAPLFVPSVAAFAQGMIVSVPLHLATLAKAPTLSDLDALFAAYYRGGAPIITYHENSEDRAYHDLKLAVDPAKGSDGMDIWVFGNERDQQALLVARLDNLGKGAAGAAVQNLKLMLGLDQTG